MGNRMVVVLMLVLIERMELMIIHIYPLTGIQISEILNIILYV